MKTIYRNGVGPTEHQIQSDLISWCEVIAPYHPELSMLFAVPNGTYKSPSARMKYQREGLKPGVPDLCMPLPSRDKKYIGLFIEMKAKRGAVSDVQKTWIDALRNAGHRVEICRQWTDAANVIIDYLDLPLTKL